MKEVLAFLFKPKFLSIPTHPDQNWTSNKNYRDLRELADRLILIGLFGISRSIFDPDRLNPVFDFLGYIFATGFVFTALDLTVSSIRLNVGQRNFKKDWERLHSSK